MSFAESLEGTLLINHCGHVLEMHLRPSLLGNSAIVYREDAHGNRGGNHDVRSLGKFFDGSFSHQLFVVDAGDSLVRLLLRTKEVLVI